jgi:hypothetical protein
MDALKELLIILGFKRRYKYNYSKYNMISATHPYNHFKYYRVKFDRLNNQIEEIEEINQKTYDANVHST